MGELWGGITAEIADATCLGIHSQGQFFWTGPLLIPNAFTMCPVLTEKAIKGAPVIEDGQVFKTGLWTGAVSIGRISRSSSAGAYPVGHTIGWKLIVIPAHIPFSGRHPLEFPFFVGPQAAIPPAFFRDLAPVGANLTDKSRLFTGRAVRELEWIPSLMMRLFNNGLDLLAPQAKAVCTHWKGLGPYSSPFPTSLAFPPVPRSQFLHNQNFTQLENLTLLISKDLKSNIFPPMEGRELKPFPF
jgi:hypothetical protein